MTVYGFCKRFHAYKWAKSPLKSHLSQEKFYIKTFLDEYASLFIESILGELPPSHGDDDHRIELFPGSSPLNKQPYRVSYVQQEEIIAQVNELMEKGMTKPSYLPFDSPMLWVQKKDRSYHMCANYRALNKITIKNIFLVPQI